MSKRRKRVFAACADTMFPPGGKIPVSGTEAGLVEYTEKYVMALTWSRRCLLLLMFLLIQLSPVLLGPRRRLLTSLKPDERLATFIRLEASAVYLFHAAFLSMRAILTFGYFVSVQVERSIMRLPASPEAAALPEPQKEGANGVTEA